MANNYGLWVNLRSWYETLHKWSTYLGHKEFGELLRNPNLKVKYKITKQNTPYLKCFLWILQIKDLLLLYNWQYRIYSSASHYIPLCMPKMIYL